MRSIPLAARLLPLLLLALGISQAKAIDPDPMIPPDCTFLAQIRPKQLMNSSLIKKLGWDTLLKTLIATNSPVQQFLDNAGVDPFQHIESIFIASTVSPTLEGQGPESADEKKQEIKPNGILVIRGSFSSKKLIKALETQGKESGAPVKKVKEGGWTLWVIPVPEMPLYVGILREKKIVVIGTRKEDVATCLKGRFDTPPIRELARALDPVEEKTSFYLAGTVPPPLKSKWKKSEDSRLFAEKLTGYSVGCHVSDKAEFSIHMITPSEPDSNLLRSQLEKELIPKAREEITKVLDSLKKSEPIPHALLTGYLEVFKKLQMKAQGPTLSLNFDLDEKFLDSLQNQSKDAEDDK